MKNEWVKRTGTNNDSPALPRAEALRYIIDFLCGLGASCEIAFALDHGVLRKTIPETFRKDGGNPKSGQASEGLGEQATLLQQVGRRSTSEFIRWRKRAGGIWLFLIKWGKNP